ncbi:MAG: multiheme c-type cytochrome, partial [Acidobacteriota bacterium]
MATSLAIGCAGAGDATGSRGAVDGRALSTATYVGRQRCAACHAEQEAGWRGSDHDRAMEVAAPGSVLGDFDDAIFEHDGRRERFFRRGDEFWVELSESDGTTRELPVAFTFGVRPLQQYLIGLPDGRYQALDVAWDVRPQADGGQRWFYLRPGESPPPGDPLHWTGVAYTWNTMCADCHSTDLRKNYDADSDSYATTYAEIDVSCEACHGPGSAHSEWARARPQDTATAGQPDPPARDAAMSAAEMGLQVDFPRIVDHSWEINPDTGLARREPPGAPAYDVELCGRCHARRADIAEDYRFGAPVSDFYRVSLLDEGLYHADGQIRDEVFVYGSFLQSRMYQSGVGCSDCHDPHGLETYNAGNALCNRCHLGSKFDTPEHYHHEVGTPGAGCVDCHMPTTTYMVVDPRRDHSFR